MGSSEARHRKLAGTLQEFALQHKERNIDGLVVFDLLSLPKHVRAMPKERFLKSLELFASRHPAGKRTGKRAFPLIKQILSLPEKAPHNASSLIEFLRRARYGLSAAYPKVAPKQEPFDRHIKIVNNIRQFLLNDYAGAQNILAEKLKSKKYSNLRAFVRELSEDARRKKNNGKT